MNLNVEWNKSTSCYSRYSFTSIFFVFTMPLVCLVLVKFNILSKEILKLSEFVKMKNCGFPCMCEVKVKYSISGQIMLQF